MRARRRWRRPVAAGILALCAAAGEAGDDEPAPIPGSYARLSRDAHGRLQADLGDRVVTERTGPPRWTLDQLRGDPVGTDTGIAFRFDGRVATTGRVAGGTLHYGLVDPDEPLPTPRWRRSVPIGPDGTAHAAIRDRLEGRYDFPGWQAAGRGVLAYRVTDATGAFLHDGRVAFLAGERFAVDPRGIVAGPFLQSPRPDGIVVQFESHGPARGRVVVHGVGAFHGPEGRRRHEIEVTGLEPDSLYAYTVDAGGPAESHAFATPPARGARVPFTFGFTSDSRSGAGGGERALGGTNAYLMRRIAMLALQRGASFVQFTGDLIDGYREHPARQRLEYANWRHAVTPVAARLPFVAGMGNHEALVHRFDDGSRYGLQVDRFPWATDSAEALFADVFANPRNGPRGEDGAAYDPDPDADDFPPYAETVFSYAWGNAAMVVLNSNYWYAPSVQNRVTTVGGNPHGYLMDRQLAWLRATLDRLERDAAIDHVFVTLHTPVFPNGGHVGDDMWYGGTNDVRPWIAGRPHRDGILERRDDFWRALQAASKVRAVLAGDEHHYARLAVGPGMPVYDGWEPDDPLTLTRTIHQITNGAAGAPYYAREDTPWNEDWDETAGRGRWLRHFSTRHALCLITVDGPRVTMDVIDPDTLAPIESAVVLAE